jgi:hypothetical protein
MGHTRGPRRSLKLLLGLPVLLAAVLLLYRECSAHTNRSAEAVALTNRTIVRDIDGGSGDVRLYEFSVPAGASDLVLTAFSEKDSAVDLYAKFGKSPTPDSYDLKDAGDAVVKMISVLKPRAGKYFVMLHGAHGRFRDVSLSASYAPKGSVFKLGMHAHRLYNGGDWNGSSSPEPEFKYGVIRDWDISKLHDAVVWKQGGAIDFKLVDQVYDHHTRRGAKVIKTFGSVPTWASMRPNEQNKQYPNWPGGKSGPRSLDEYEDYVLRFVSHTKNALWAVEGWNEPYGCTPERSEFTTMTPTELADVQKRVYLATKRVSKNILVFSPAQAYVCGIPIILNARTSQNEPMSQYFDALAWHPYNRSARGDGRTSYVAEVSRVRRMLAEAGLRDMPIVDTEHGWLTAPKEGGKEFYAMSDDEKAQVLYETALLAKSLGVLAVAWYGYDNNMIGKPMTSPRISRGLQQSFEDFDSR